MSNATYFWARVDRNGPTPDYAPSLGPCWLWTGSLNRLGYGNGRYDGRTMSAHRAAYTLLVGPIPKGMQLDHLCRVRRCVNPAHLEPVTQSTNMLRARSLITHCPQGHPYDEVNTYWHRGRRNCRACRNVRWMNWYRKSRS